MKPIFCIFAVLTALAMHGALAQPNILGLPVVPQTPVVDPATAPPVSNAASAASTAQGGKAVRPKAGAAAATAVPAAPQVTDADAKSVLNGGVTMATSYTHTLANLRITTNTLYKDEAQRKQAINAGRLVQRDLRMACGKQCKPASMTAPKILPDGKLQFDLAVDGFNRLLNSEDMMAMLLGRPLAFGAAKPAVAALAAAAKSTPTAADAKPVPASAVPPLVSNPPALPAVPDAVRVTRSIIESSPSSAEPTK